MKKSFVKSRITFNPKILRGKPIVQGTRISVELILELLASDWAFADILLQYPQLTKADILAALGYSAKRLKREEILFTHALAS
ncbi:MAG: DUF433 domain-containing protein [Bacteroidetes bacterium]|nr:DUF433 domain-containing protein [Bacteroidota bacterium]